MKKNKISSPSHRFKLPLLFFMVLFFGIIIGSTTIIALAKNNYLKFSIGTNSSEVYKKELQNNFVATMFSKYPELREKLELANEYEVVHAGKDKYLVNSFTKGKDQNIEQTENFLVTLDYWQKLDIPQGAILTGGRYFTIENNPNVQSTLVLSYVFEGTDGGYVTKLFNMNTRQFIPFSDPKGIFSKYEKENRERDQKRLKELNIDETVKSGIFTEDGGIGTGDQIDFSVSGYYFDAETFSMPNEELRLVFDAFTGEVIGGIDYTQFRDLRPDDSRKEYMSRDYNECGLLDFVCVGDTHYFNGFDGCGCETL